MWERGAEGLGAEVPQWGPGAKPRQLRPPEADAYLLMNAQILTFWRNKLVKQSGFRHYTVRKKLRSGQRGGASPTTPNGPLNTPLLVVCVIILLFTVISMSSCNFWSTPKRIMMMNKVYRRQLIQCCATGTTRAVVTIVVVKITA